MMVVSVLLSDFVKCIELSTVVAVWKAILQDNAYYSSERLLLIKRIKNNSTIKRVISRILPSRKYAPCKRTQRITNAFLYSSVNGRNNLHIVSAEKENKESGLTEIKVAR